MKKQLKILDKKFIRFLENSLLINKEILVFGDVHIGYEELYSSSLLRVQMKDIYELLKKIFKRLHNEKIILKKIIILGDLKHEFGTISEGEWRDVLNFLNYLEKKCEKIIIIKGNHDKIIGPILNKRNVELVNYWIEEINNSKDIKKIGFLHGDKWFSELKECDNLILGHSHPAIILKDKYKQEKYKCFLKGNWNKKEILIIPSFNLLNQGYNLNDFKINKNKGFSIVPDKIIIKMNVLVYNKKEDKIYDFGKLKNFN